MKTTALITLLTASCCIAFSGAAIAQATAPAATMPASGTMTKDQAKVADNQADAKYKATKKNAEGQEAMAKADCTALKGKEERECKKKAAAAEKQMKADAKAEHKKEEADIKAAKP